MNINKLLSNPNHILCELTKDDFKLAKELFREYRVCSNCGTDTFRHERHDDFLTGEIEVYTYCDGCQLEIGEDSPLSKIYSWQYHLQQLIISPDPVAYIRENTKGDK